MSIPITMVFFSLKASNKLCLHKCILSYFFADYNHCSCISGNSNLIWNYLALIMTKYSQTSLEQNEQIFIPIVLWPIAALFMKAIVFGIWVAIEKIKNLFFTVSLYAFGFWQNERRQMKYESTKEGLCIKIKIS